ncbi:josephin-like protein [Magnolia sinica]|uniref:josephin-like protein n=1 Tax=Magnolia sinica TaxID=86752 RepID=UPI00265B0141|nr:josephin-like protein [Magnolia sinica]
MSRKTSKRVSFSPDITEKPKLSLKPDTGTRAAGNRKRVAAKFGFRLPRSTGFSPAKFLRRLGTSVVRTVRFFSVRRVSPKACPSSRSRPSVSPHDSHRSEDIEDCIEFINSSFSLERSNSVSASSW